MQSSLYSYSYVVTNLAQSDNEYSKKNFINSITIKANKQTKVKIIKPASKIDIDLPDCMDPHFHVYIFKRKINYNQSSHVCVVEQ